MCVYIYMYIYIYCVYMCIYIYTHIYIYMYVYIYVYIYMYMIVVIILVIFCYYCYYCRRVYIYICTIMYQYPLESPSNPIRNQKNTPSPPLPSSNLKSHKNNHSTTIKSPQILQGKKWLTPPSSPCVHSGVGQTAFASHGRARASDRAGSGAPGPGKRFFVPKGCCHQCSL